MTGRCLKLLVTLSLAVLLAGCVAGGARQVRVPEARGRVVIYHEPGCPYCQQARQFLRLRGVPMLERNVRHDPSALAEFLAVYRQRLPQEEPIVPLMLVEGEVLAGFEVEALTGALDRAGLLPP